MKKTERSKDRKVWNSIAEKDKKKTRGGGGQRGMVITNFWSSVPDDHWSKKIYGLRWLLMSDSLFILRWTCCQTFLHRCKNPLLQAIRSRLHQWKSGCPGQEVRPCVSFSILCHFIFNAFQTWNQHASEHSYGLLRKGRAVGEARHNIFSFLVASAIWYFFSISRVFHHRSPSTGVRGKVSWWSADVGRFPMRRISRPGLWLVKSTFHVRLKI